MVALAHAPNRSHSLINRKAKLHLNKNNGGRKKWKREKKMNNILFESPGYAVLLFYEAY